MADPVGICEACLFPFSAADLEDGVTMESMCCERMGLCNDCREHGQHDCAEVPRG